jgi:PilZ domain
VRLRRLRPEEVSQPVAIPARGEAVLLSTSAGGHIPARVAELEPDVIVIAMLVPVRPFSAHDLETMVLLFNNAHGRIRLSGEFSVDPSDPELLRLRNPRSIEVLQQREYVRIKAARPVVVYRVGDRMELPSYTVDLSGGGLLLAGPETLECGDEVQFTITIQPGQPPVTGKGRVVRKDGHGRGGVIFEDISELDRRRLVRFIFECQRIERHRDVSEEEQGG